MHVLGLDIGSNSVGSAWIDTANGEIIAGVSVFPAGVEESDDKRGAPKNQARRQKRSLRRSIRRRAQRKKALREYLIEQGFLLSDPAALLSLMNVDPWHLRSEALTRPLTLHEFGRVLVHLNQRRGAAGLRVKEEGDNDKDDEKAKDEGRVKKAIEETKEKMRESGSKTFGEFMARLHDEGKSPVRGKTEKFFHNAIRNRRDSFKFHADRTLIRGELDRIWQAQKTFGGELAKRLTDDFRKALDDEKEGGIWRHQGIIFGQRKTYWNMGTLGRCDLEPTDQKCPLADMHAQEFRVLETVNNIRVRASGEAGFQPLSLDERSKVIGALESVKKATIATLRKALWPKKQQQAFFELNLERDAEREINTNWFMREIMVPVFGERWTSMTERERESVNRAIQKFDPEMEGAALEKFTTDIQRWWNIGPDQAAAFIAAWKKRPKIEERVNLSRRALENLLPYMRLGDSLTEARRDFARDTSNNATPEQRARYAFNVDGEVEEAIAAEVGQDKARKLLESRGVNKKKRRYMEKHKGELPPAPVLSNPVVRKTVHEVRRHINEYIKRFGRKPDRVVIEMARETKETAKQRNNQLALNRKRDRDRKEILEFKPFGLQSQGLRQQRKAVERVLLCRQQKGLCPYCASTSVFSEPDAAAGNGVETDHIIPSSRGGASGWNNLVLCHRACNRDKSRQTAREWLEQRGGLDALEQRFAHFRDPDKSVLGFFSKKDFQRKWKNLHREVKDSDVKRWRESQLSDTSYAARQVAEYLQYALFSGAPRDKKQIQFTKGRVTAMLRRDWQLYHEIESMGSDEEAWDRLTKKDRSDHRHHALDAIVIALTDDKTVKQLVSAAEAQEEYKEKYGKYPSRDPLPVPKPWKDVKSFRDQVIPLVFGDAESHGLIVANRPLRSLTDALHKDNPFGSCKEYPGLYSFRVNATPQPKKFLKPSNLRAPKENTSAKGDRWFSIEGKGQGSVVRDASLRKALRECLERNGFDPENFGEKEMKALTNRDDYKLRWPSGVPIFKITMMRTLGDPIEILGSDGVMRYYQGGNNHHIDIVEDTKTGKWTGICVRMFEAARRVKPPKEFPKLPLFIGPSLNKLRVNGVLPPDPLGRYDPEDYERKKFVMTLSKGEMLYMKSPVRAAGRVRPYDYFTVVKTSPDKIYVVHHADARPAKVPKGSNLVTREMKMVSVSKLPRDYVLPDGTPPRKVRVGPLGVIGGLESD